MKKQLYKYILFILLFLPLCLFAQPTKPADHDMTGLWKGTLYNDTTKKFLPYEIAISEEKGKLVGYSYTLFEEDGKKEVGVKRIKIKIKDDEVIIEDVEMISNNYSIAPPKKVRVQSVLSLYLNDTSMQLSGRWSTNKTWEYRQLTGNLQVNRAIDYKETALFERLTELKLTKDLSFVQPDKNSTGADIAIKEKPVKEKKLPSETPEKLVAVEKQKEVIAAPDTKTSMVVENKASGKEISKTAEPISKNIIDTPAKTKPATDEKTVVVVDKPTDKAIAKTDAPVSKNSVDKPAIGIDKKAVLPGSVNEVVVKEKQPADQSIAKNTIIEKPSTITPAITGKKTDISTKDSIAKNGRPVDVAAIKPAEKPKSVVVPPVEKKKEVVVAVNDSKAAANQAAVVNKPAIVLPPVTKQPAPIVALKEPAKQNEKPAVAVTKAPAVAEKPIVIAAPKEPVKTETKAIAAVGAPAEKKKDIPVEISAPVLVAAPIVVAAANVADRKMKNEQAVYFESDSLVLTLYDNGEVDGDTVSVLMNGQIIFAKQGLSTKANSKTIYIDKSMSDSLSMVMYAENLGSIPPNTGLLIIMDGEKRYEVRFSADLQTNAAILLRRKQKEK